MHLIRTKIEVRTKKSVIAQYDMLMLSMFLLNGNLQ